MEFSIVNFNDVIANDTLRLDAQYYSEDVIEDENNIKRINHKTLKELDCKIVSGPFGSDLKSCSYLSQGIPFIRISDLSDFFIDLSNLVYISDSDNSRLSNSILNVDDLVISKVGNTIGVVSKVSEDVGVCNISENNIGIKFSKNIKKETKNYILAFLNSRIGQRQILRRLSGNAQPKLNVADIYSLSIPFFDIEFEKKVSNYIDNIKLKIDKSKKYFNECIKLLNDEIGFFDENKTDSTLFSIANSKQVFEFDRLDSEYYLDKCTDIVDVVKRYSFGWDYLGNLIKIKDKNYQLFCDKKYKYIEISNVSQYGYINNCNKDFVKNLPARARCLVQKNDVIVSSVESSIGCGAIIDDEFDNSLCTSGFFVFDSDFYNPQTLMCLIKLPQIQKLFKKGCSGTILCTINKNEVSKIPLPKIRAEIQKQIEFKINKSIACLKDSKKLIEDIKNIIDEQIILA